MDELYELCLSCLSDDFVLDLSHDKILTVALPSASKAKVKVNLQDMHDEDDIRDYIHDKVIEYLGECFLR